MGNAASKAPRRLSKTQTKEIPRASESLNRMKAPPKEEILKDGQDPDFSANLSKIDPVKIHKTQTNFKPVGKQFYIVAKTSNRELVRQNDGYSQRQENRE